MKHIMAYLDSVQARVASLRALQSQTQEEFAVVVVRVESLRGRLSEAGRQVERLFESLLADAFM